MKPVKLTYIYAKNYVTVEIDLMDVTQVLEPMQLQVDINNFITFLYFLSWSYWQITLFCRPMQEGVANIYVEIFDEVNIIPTL